MAIKASSGCARTRLCAVITFLVLLKFPSVSCSRPMPRGSIFHLFSSWVQNHDSRLQNPSSSLSPAHGGVPEQIPYSPTVGNQEQPHQHQMSTTTTAETLQDKASDSESHKDSNLGMTAGDESARRLRRPPAFQMLPRNTRPPPRGPSPGSNSLGSP
ncbi:protein MpIDA4 [Marchantia polymorpha subsp. ruderalis]|uniref:Uncharacterized protein n=2 Tax=Marchantia polymorpha TaxID=3197 RepID=A0AAF6BY98_MARPO|nr:hypothetical protein MARPO_0003s0111 [Marchantia polymorpha]BBN16982.1 hypothetical protein Mp_7g10970 [Marchantia polymorpha subsp. ruderalis]|eukprot:PTQ49219.1 hypothetical protein MARPO_0003s0111 [Marchantia polymorpha]